MSSLTSKLAAVDRRVYAAATIVLILIVLAVGGTLGYAVYQDSQPTSPSLNLKDGQKEVALDQQLVLKLLRPASADAVTAHFHITPAIDGHLEPAADRRTFTWTSTGPWADLTEYQVRLDPLTDDRKAAIKSGTWKFTTTIVPRVTTLTNDTGTAIADDSELPVGSNLKLGFNEAMDAATVKVLANGNPLALAWDADNKTAGFATKGIPVGPLALTLAAGGRDLLGHSLPTDWKVSATLVFKVNIHTTPLKFPALVQVPNDPGAWDQSGLQAADMVFEYATEGGIPRFTAVFTNVPDKVGPVRSGRLISIKLTRHYHGQLFLSGMSEGTFGVLNRDPVPTFFDTQGYFYRTSDHRAPDNLYINGDAIQRAEGQLGLGDFALKTGRPGLSGGAPAAEAAVPEHSATYALDADTKTYMKSEQGHRFGDTSTGQPLRISLVIVMHMPVTVTGIIEDVNGAHGLDYNTEGGGRAEFYYQGLKYAGTWSAADRSSPFTFALDGGQQVSLPAGLVWVDAVP